MCPLVDAADEPRWTYAVQSGPTLWLFSSAALAEIQVRVLYEGGAHVQMTEHATDADVQAMIRALPAKNRQTIEDVR